MASVMAASIMAAQQGHLSTLQRIQAAKPPHPAGDQATYFPYSAQTAPHRSGNSTHSLSISLSKDVYRPSEQLTGSLAISPRQPSSEAGDESGFLSVRRVDLRVYCESRTMFWNFALPREGQAEVLKEVYDDLDLPPEDALPADDEDERHPAEGEEAVAVEEPEQTPPAARRRTLPLPAATLPRARSSGALAARGPNVSAPPSGGGRPAPEGDLLPAHEWHRIFADRQTLEVASPDRHPLGHLQVPLDSARWPFHVHLPARSRHVAECNWFRGAPRDLQHVHRPMPGTVRDNRNGSVEWVVEAVVTLAGDEEEERVQLDERGMLKPDKHHLVARQVFELVPSPPAGRGPASGHTKLPRGFSDDPLARVHGAVLARPDGAFDPMSGRLVGGAVNRVSPPPLPPWIPGGDEGWRRFARTHRIETAVMRRKVGMLRFELALPKEEWVGKGRKELGWRAWVMWEGKGGNKDRAGRKREVWTEGFEVIISKRTLTRGGADRRGHQIVEPVRHAYFPASRLLAPGIANQFSFSLDLQSTDPNPPPTPRPGSAISSPDSSRQLPLSSLCPTLRMPNLERDLVLQIYIRFATQHPRRPEVEEVQQIPSISLVRVALHLLEEEQEQLPAFEDAVGYRPRPPLYRPDKPEWEEELDGDGDATPRASRSRAPSYRTQASSTSRVGLAEEEEQED